MDKRGAMPIGRRGLTTIVYLIIGAIFLNEPFQIFPGPDLTEWWLALAGVLLIIAGFFNSFKTKPKGVTLTN